MNSVSKLRWTPNSWSGVVNSLWIQLRNINNFLVVHQINTICRLQPQNSMVIQHGHLLWFNSDLTLKCRLGCASIDWLICQWFVISRLRALSNICSIWPDSVWCEFSSLGTTCALSRTRGKKPYELLETQSHVPSKPNSRRHCSQAGGRMTSS